MDMQLGYFDLVYDPAPFKENRSMLIHLQLCTFYITSLFFMFSRGKISHTYNLRESVNDLCFSDPDSEGSMIVVNNHGKEFYVFENSERAGKWFVYHFWKLYYEEDDNLDEKKLRQMVEYVDDLINSNIDEIGVTLYTCFQKMPSQDHVHDETVFRSLYKLFGNEESRLVIQRMARLKICYKEGREYADTLLDQESIQLGAKQKDLGVEERVDDGFLNGTTLDEYLKSLKKEESAIYDLMHDTCNLKEFNQMDFSSFGGGDEVSIVWTSLFMLKGIAVLPNVRKSHLKALSKVKQKVRMWKASRKVICLALRHLVRHASKMKNRLPSHEIYDSVELWFQNCNVLIVKDTKEFQDLQSYICSQFGVEKANRRYEP